MLLVYCPYCEEAREEEEFTYGGEAHIERPLSHQTLTDEEWGDYLYFRKNPRGLHHEMWFQHAGCRRYFCATRDTVTYKILETDKIGGPPKSPSIPVGANG